jgi:transcriptional regulator with XRE-family HTH domain
MAKKPREAGTDFDVPARCRAARQRQGLTIADLAAKARVSNRSVSQIEEGVGDRRLIDVLRSTEASARQRRAWARVLAKVALALGEDPAAWLGWLRQAGIALQPEELNNLLASARRRVQGTSRGLAGMLDEFRAAQRARPEEPFEVPVHLLTFGKEAEGQNNFFRKFIELAFSAINPWLRAAPSEGVTTFDRLMASLTKPPPRYRVVVGAFQMVGRSHHGVAFIPIPGWRLRLACLAAADAPLSWQDVREEGRRLPHDRKGLQVVTIAGEAGDVYLRSFCDYAAARLDTLAEYDIEKAAARLHCHLRDDRPGRTTVLVTGEYEASAVRHHMRRHYGRELKDLAARDGADPPSYPLALATAAEDKGWTETLRQAVAELFTNAGAIMAELYGQYMEEVIEEAVGNEGQPGEPPYRVVRAVLGLEETARLPPSYLRLDEFDFPVPRAFRKRLEGYLRDKARQRHWVDPADSAATNALLMRLIPWLGQVTPESTLEEVRRLGEQLGRQEQLLRELRDLVAGDRRPASPPPEASVPLQRVEHQAAQ